MSNKREFPSTLEALALEIPDFDIEYLKQVWANFDQTTLDKIMDVTSNFTNIIPTEDGRKLVALWAYMVGEKMLALHTHVLMEKMLMLDSPISGTVQ